MNREIIIFLKENYNMNIRSVKDVNGEYWYVAADILKYLGYKNVSKTLSTKCKYTRKYEFWTNSGTQYFLCINYIDLIRLILTAKKTELDEIKEWLITKMCMNPLI